MKMKRLVWMLMLLLAALLPLAVGAHAGLTSAEPAPGSTLSQSPSEIRLAFSEPVGALSTVDLYRDGFQRVDGITGQMDATERNVLIAPLPALDDGVYTVQYVAVSADGHEITGSYTFELASNPLPSWLLWLAVGAVVSAGLGLLRRRRRR